MKYIMIMRIMTTITDEITRITSEASDSGEDITLCELLGSIGKGLELAKNKIKESGNDPVIIRGK